MYHNKKETNTEKSFTVHLWLPIIADCQYLGVSSLTH